MVFFVSIFIVILLVLFGSLMPESFTAVTSALLSFTTNNFGWFYLLVAFTFLIFALFLAFSRYGKIRLGDDDDEPEYTKLSWFALLFSAGMGIGLVFWGAAEPLSHYATPPAGGGHTEEAARLALRYSFFHWGLHPWAIYTVLGLAISYFRYRKGSNGLISSTFEPYLGSRVNGWIGRSIDVLTILATAFGVATSLGLGVLQVAGGLNHLAKVPNTLMVQLLIIAIATVIFILSTTTGLEKGLKLLSNLCLVFSLLLLVSVLILGPTTSIFDAFTTTLGSYLQNIIQMSLRLAPFTQNSWIANWTLFYWAWWISWAPFVGIFIARISKGRTIKEFVLGVLIVPSLFSFLWFSIFGGTGLHQQMIEGVPLTKVVEKDISLVLFYILEHLPLGVFIAWLAMILVILFYITAGDSATFVLGMLSTNGSDDPLNWVKIVWGILQSAIAMVLLMTGGLEALQTAAIVSALPFAIIMLGMCASLLKILRQDERERRRKEKKRERSIREWIEKQIT
ncbi:glycine betaine uptake BCCT transporter [Bacillus sp. T33-2]|uniref:glycine betaine uptake BCCT transporter n=1 Tax=Bacillus sp. T33-2 TaxID=2054168 RepID=UPI000C775410|nr:BCCT family transporter [Bacillus sp. T33-2]PLR89789.1 glycine/betaine ABC transporter permease [Bacillus sp. T33-2]